jgi:hypothetical protein
MLHEHLQAHIVRKDRLPSIRTWRRPVHRVRHVRRGRVELRQQEPRLASTLVADDVPGYREAVNEEVLNNGTVSYRERREKKSKGMTADLCVCDGGFQQLFEVLVSFLFLVALLSPLRNELAVEDEDVEEGVEQQHDIVLDGDAVEQNRLRGYVECVRHERGLDHDEGVIDILLVEDVSENHSSISKFL